MSPRVVLSRSRFARFSWVALVYTVAVTLWGAFVRASISGDGCGPHWPLCNGEVIPTNHVVKTAIEFVHRISVAGMTPVIVVLIAWAFYAYPRRHPVRLGATLTFLFTAAEAAVGALLVLRHLVALNPSPERAVWMAVHLVTTFMLLASIALTAWWSGDVDGSRRPVLRGQGALGWALAIALGSTLVLAVSGAVTALGDTLYKTPSFSAGLRADFAPGASILLRLRILHPLIAVSAGLVVALTAGLVAHLRPSEQTRRLARWIVAVFALELAAGALNALLSAPIAMQLAHLYIADLLWITLVLFAAAAVAAEIPVAASSALDVPEPTGRATWRDYMALTKPRVISLLLFTTLAAMFIASDHTHHVSPLVFICVAVGGYMAAGAANATNMVIDSDIDRLMRRTTSRPTVTQRVSQRSALYFALVLGAGSFVLLWAAANLLAAALAFAGLVYYVIVYTLLLKRRTWQNIVIGGAAGAFPPLVGWAAVTGNLSPLAWYLFGIIFLWTPVHFWALALLLKDDYSEAGVPMLPVVLGDRVTVVQIALYGVLTATISVLPLLQAQWHLGLMYLVAAVLLNGFLLARCWSLLVRPGRPQARSLFHYSMVYLALLFLVMAVDRAAYAHTSQPSATRPSAITRAAGP